MPKAPVAKAAPMLLQTVARVGNDPAPDIREAALCMLVAFALKLGSTLPAKVRRQQAAGSLMCAEQRLRLTMTRNFTKERWGCLAPGYA